MTKHKERNIFEILVVKNENETKQCDWPIQLNWIWNRNKFLNFHTIKIASVRVSTVWSRHSKRKMAYNRWEWNSIFPILTKQIDRVCLSAPSIDCVYSFVRLCSKVMHVLCSSIHHHRSISVSVLLSACVCLPVSRQCMRWRRQRLWWRWRWQLQPRQSALLICSFDDGCTK